MTDTIITVLMSKLRVQKESISNLHSGVVFHSIILGNMQRQLNKISINATTGVANASEKWETNEVRRITEWIRH